MDSTSSRNQENHHKSHNNNNNVGNPISRSGPANPYPTTFVQADTSSFKQVVQMLTGSNETAKQASSNPTRNPNRESGFKLYQRRNSSFNINPLLSSPPSSSSRKQPEILSPSVLDFPALVLSPVTPLLPDPFTRPGADSSFDAEEKAIKEKGFYFHPSPASTPRDTQPRLLPLFPTTSPRAASGSSSPSSVS